MKSTSLRIGSFALAALLITFAATGQETPAPRAPAGATPGGQAPPPDANQPGGRGTRVNVQRGNVGGGAGINLDDKQRELLQEARQVNSDEVRKLNEKLAEAQKELVKVVVAEKYDEKVVREKAEAVAKIQTDLLMLNAKAFATVSPTLKPEQREQLENSRMAIAIISPGGGFGGGAGVNFAAGPNAGLGGGRGNVQGGGDGGPGFGGGGRGGDAGGIDRGGRRGGNDVNAGNGNNRRRGDNPPQ